ncbi:glycosyltransferase family 2 protein, partial [Pelagibacteraceae bacterium]|nr:glycosyltransferase family 2 protein [Pelagibacteraceae bacterium]
RTCASVTMLTQNKTRLFEKDKIEYTLRTIHSLLDSIKPGSQLKNININFKVIDHNSTEKCLTKIDNIFKDFNTKYSLINLDVEKFKKKINPINEKGDRVTANQMSNMANIHQSLLEAKKSKDLIYFVEDDYIHNKNSIEEMIFTYERIATQLNKEIILCPTDYPYLYAKADITQIFLGHKYHWRKVNETLCTFLTSKLMIEKYWDKYISICEKEHSPFEKPMHEIYEKELCISPVPSIAIHLTNINSIYGLSPNVDWKKIWDENKI